MSEDPVAPESVEGGAEVFPDEGTFHPRDFAAYLGNTAVEAVTNPLGGLSNPVGEDGSLSFLRDYPSVDETPDPAADANVEPDITQRTLAGLVSQPGQPQGPLLGPKPEGGVGGIGGSVSVTASPPIPAELLEAQRAYLGGRADLAAAYQTERAKALGIMVDIGQEFAHGLETETEKTLEQADALLTTAEQEASAIDDLVEAALSNRVNPGQFFANVGAAGRFSAALAMAGGAASAAVLGGGPNHAYNIITRAIDRNVRAQVVNQQHDRAMISHQINLVNTFRGLSNDRAQYGNYVRLGLAAIAKAKMGVTANQLGQTAAQLGARDVYMRLGAYLVEQQIKALSNMSARYTFKFKTLGQAQQIQRMIGGQAGGAAPIAARRQTSGGQPSRANQNAASVGAAQEQPQYTVPIPVGPKQTIPFKVARGREDFARSIFLDKTKGPEAIAAVSKATSNLEDTMRLIEGLRLGAFISSKRALLKPFIVNEHGNMKMRAFLELPKRERQAIVDQISTRLIKAGHLEEAGNTRNSMNMIWERDMATEISGMDMTMFDYLAHLGSADTQRRIAQTGDRRRKAVSTLRTTLNQYGLDSDIVPDDVEDPGGIVE